MKFRLSMLLLIASLPTSMTAYGQERVSSQTTGIAPDRFMGGITRDATVHAPATRREPASRARTYKAAKSIRDICRGC